MLFSDTLMPMAKGGSVRRHHQKTRVEVLENDEDAKPKYLTRKKGNPARQPRLHARVYYKRGAESRG